MTQGSPAASTPAHLTTGRSRRGAGALWTLRAAATLELAALLLQSVTAGGLLGGTDSAWALHGSGSTLVHVFGVALLVGGILVWRPGRGPGWPAIVALVVLLGGFVQSMLGGSGSVAAHVPTGVTLTILATWLTVWAWGRRPASTTAA